MWQLKHTVSYCGSSNSLSLAVTALTRPHTLATPTFSLKLTLTVKTLPTHTHTHSLYTVATCTLTATYFHCKNNGKKGLIVKCRKRFVLNKRHACTNTSTPTVSSQVVFVDDFRTDSSAGAAPKGGQGGAIAPPQ